LAWFVLGGWRSRAERGGQDIAVASSWTSLQSQGMPQWRGRVAGLLRVATESGQGAKRRLVADKDSGAGGRRSCRLRPILPSVVREPEGSRGGTAAVGVRRATGARLAAVVQPKAPTRLAQLLPRPGVRKTHLGLLLERFAPGGPGRTPPPLDAESRRFLTGALTRVAPRLAPSQLLAAVSASSHCRLSSQTLAALAPHMQGPLCAEAFRRQPGQLIATLDVLAEPASEARDINALNIAQMVAFQFAGRVAEYGSHALPVLAALARAGGGRALRRLSEDGAARLIQTAGEQAGLLAASAVKSASSATGSSVDASGVTASRMAEPRVLDEASAADACSLYCIINQLGHRDPALGSALSRHLANHIDNLETSSLPSLARAINPSLGRALSAEDFVLLHALCRRATASMDELDGPGVVVMLQAAGRYDLFDEEFLAAVSDHLMSSHGSLRAQQLGDAMYAFGHLQVRDSGSLDKLCDTLRSRLREIGEADLVRFMRGMVKLRHTNEELLTALAPVIDKMKSSLSSVSLTNLINCFASFNSTNGHFLKSLLHAASSRSSRLTPMSVQHVLTALCRQHGLLESEELHLHLQRICQHMAEPGVAAQLTPIQAVASFSALSKLHYQDLAAAGVLTSVLAGRGSAVVWTWAPSAFFFAHGRPWSLPAEYGVLNEARCLQLLQRELDSSHCVDILQSLHRLDLTSALTLRLALLLCGRLLPHLHELRARDVLVVARSMSAWRLPGRLAPELEASLTGALAAAPLAHGAEDDAEEEGGRASGAEQSWRERLVEYCFENLRRHEHWLESSWNTLLPLKLLCMEVDCGTYDSRRLVNLLSPDLFAFVDRLRHITREECEAHRLRREGGDEDEAASAGGSDNEGSADDGAAASLTGDKGAVERSPQAASGSEPAAAGLQQSFAVEELPWYRIVVGGFVQDFPVDFLIQPKRP